MKLRHRFISGSFLVVLSMVQTTLGGTLYWDASDQLNAGAQGGTGTWDSNSTANWWDGAANVVWPAPGGTDDDAVFGGNAGTVTVTTATANGITFESPDYTISGGTLTLNGTAPAITNELGIDATISSVIDGTVGLSKVGSGTLILSGANTYSGGTAIQSGTLQVNAGGTLGSITGALSMGTGSSGVVGTVGNLTVNSDVQSGSFSVQSNTANISGANIGQLLIDSGRTLAVGGLSIGVSQGGTNNPINTALATGSANSGTLTVSGDVTVGLSTGGTGSQAITSADLSGLANFNAGSGTGNFRVGYGVLNRATLTLASTANIINVASISVGETTGNGNSSQNNILNLGAGTNSLQTSGLNIGTQKASGVIQFAGSHGSVAIGGSNGSGTTNITIGTNNSSGTYQPGNLHNGLLLAGHNATVNAAAVIIGNRSSTGAGTITAQMTFDTGTFNASNITLARATNGHASSATAVNGTLTLGTDSSSTGVTTLSGNLLVASHTSSAVGVQTATGTLNVLGGTLSVNTVASITGGILNNSTTTTGVVNTTLTLDGGTLDLNGGIIGGSGASGSRLIGTLNFRSGTLRNVRQINNGAGLTKTTTGTLLLSGSNLYTGTTQVNEGILQVNGGAAIVNTGLVSLADVADVSFRVIGSETIGALAGGGTTGGKLVVDSGQTLTLSSGTQNFAGIIEGSGGIEIRGATQTLSGDNNAYAGTVTLSGGTLNIGHANALGSGPFINSNGTNTLTNTSGAAITLANSSYSVSSSLIFGGSASTNNIDTGSSSFTLSGVDRILSVGGGVTTNIGGEVIGSLRKDGNGTLVLSGTSDNDFTSIRVTQGNLQLTGSTGVATQLTMGHPTASNVGKFTLGGTVAAVHQTFGQLQSTGSAQASQSIVGGNAAVSILTVNQSTDTTYAGVLGGAGTNENNLGLTKEGSGSLTLTGANTYVGNTTVSQGILRLGDGVTNTNLADGADVSVASGATLDLNYSGTDTIDGLTINGVAKAPGVWGSASSGAPNTDPQLTGTGTLTVTTGPSASAYDSWTSGFSLTGPDAAFDFDYDNDGIENGLEWILGGNPTSNSAGILPVATKNVSGDLVLTFNREEDSITESTLKVQFGTDLASWPKEVTIGGSSSGPDTNGVTVSIDTAASPDAVTVTIPGSNAPTGSIFARLNATRP